MSALRFLQRPARRQPPDDALPLRDRACRKRFSVQTGTVMEASNIGYRKLALAIHLLSSRPKGI